VEHGLSAVDGPAHARLFQPIFHHVSASALGHTAADGVAGGQVFVAASAVYNHPQGIAAGMQALRSVSLHSIKR